MPKVGNRKFAYTPEGEEAAEDFAMETGQNVISSYDAGGRVEKIQGYGKGGKVKGSKFGEDKFREAIKSRKEQMRKDWETHFKAEKELKEKYPEYKAPAEAKKKKGGKKLTSRAKHLIKKLKPRGKGGAGGAGGDLPRRKRPGIK